MPVARRAETAPERATYTMRQHILSFYLVVSSFYWGAAFVLTKISLIWIPPVILGLYRHGLAAIFLLPMFWQYQKTSFSQIKRTLLNNWRLYVPLSLTGIAIPTVLQNIGMLYISASLSGLIQGAGPAMTAMLAILVLKEQPTLEKIAGGSLAVLGAMLLALLGNTQYSMSGGLAALGGLLLFFSAVSYAISGLISKICVKTASPHVVAIIETSLGTIFLAPFIAIDMFMTQSNVSTILKSPTESQLGFLSLLLLAIYPTAIGLYLWYYVLYTFSLSKQAFYIYLTPIFSAFLGVSLLNEHLSYTQILLSAITLIGVYIVAKSHA